MAPQQALEEPLSSNPTLFSLEIHIDHLTILINGPPQVMLLAIDFDEDFIDEKCIPIATMLSLQSSGE